MELNVKLDPMAFLPEQAHPTDAGLDLRTPHDVLVMPGVGARGGNEMTDKELVQALRNTETRSKRGLLDEAADRLEKLADELHRATANVGQEWISVEERLPEVWRNDDTAELVNYMIYSPDFGVDIGNYHAKAKRWLCMALPCIVTHWMPLPPRPEKVE